MSRTEINPKDHLLPLAIGMIAACFVWYGSASAEERGSESANVLLKISASREWKLLLHYRTDFKGAERSEIIKGEFFFSPIGNVNALAELEATIDALKRPLSYKTGPYEQHPQCAFPERFHFLKSKLAISWPEAPCPEFTKWRIGLNVKKVVLVFAAPYMGNPASLFGHTFLRFGSGGSEMLDAGVSFDAMPTTDNRIKFVFKGLTGGYTSGFSQTPYYMKIDSYSHLENRDLHEYELNLDQMQIDRMVRHLWELGGARFEYYFLSENCAYYLLSLLEVANPDWKLRERFHVMTIPIDSIRALVEIPGAIRYSQTRISLFAQMETKVAALKLDERARFYLLRHDPSKLKGGESPELLDALIDWEKYRPSAFQAQLLLARAGFRSNLIRAIPEVAAVPSLGRKTSKVEIDFAREAGLARFAVALRPALQDELDAEGGEVTSSLTVLKTAISYFPEPGKIGLEELTFASVESKPAMTLMRSPPSWLLGIGLDRPRDTRCLDCIAGKIRGGLGATVSALSGRANFTLMGVGQAEISNAFTNSYAQEFRAGPSLRLSSVVRLFDGLRLGAVVENFWYFGSLGKSLRYGRLALTLATALGEHQEIRIGFETHSRDISVETDAVVAFGHFF